MTPEQIKEHYPYVARGAWERPSSYIGPNHPESYAISGRHRDSSTVERANFASFLEELEEWEEHLEVVRDNHWAVGWVETLRLHKDAPPEAFQQANHMVEYLMEVYPVLDDDRVSEIEQIEITEYLNDWGYRDLANEYEIDVLIPGHQEAIERVVDEVVHHGSGDELTHDGNSPYMRLEAFEEAIEHHFPHVVFDERFVRAEDAKARALDVAFEYQRLGYKVELREERDGPFIRLEAPVGTPDIIPLPR